MYVHEFDDHGRAILVEKTCENCSRRMTHGCPEMGIGIGFYHHDDELDPAECSRFSMHDQAHFEYPVDPYEERGISRREFY